MTVVTIQDVETKSIHHKVFVASIIAFVFIALLHYFSQRPLWMDEQYVFASIEGYHYGQIFGPLKTEQAFPRVYLVLIKFLSDIFNLHLLALRFFPLVAMFLAFYVWQKNYRLNIKEAGVWLLSIVGFAASFRMAYYAAELKPYSMDVLSVGLFVLYFYYQNQFLEKKSTRWFNLISMLMPFLLFFSYASLFVFWMIGFNFLWMLKRNKALLKPFFLNAVTSVICYFVLYQIDLKHFMYVSGYYSYWKNYFLGHTLKGFFTPFGEGYVEIGTWWFGESRLCKKLGMVFLPFLFYSLVRYGWGTWKQNGFRIFTLENIFGVLFLELVVFSFLGHYPFTGDRITLFFAPFVFYLILKAIEDLKRVSYLYLFFKSYYIFYLGFCYLSSVYHFMLLYR